MSEKVKPKSCDGCRYDGPAGASDPCDHCIRRPYELEMEDFYLEASE